MADIEVVCEGHETRYEKKKSFTVYVFSVRTSAGVVMIYRRYSAIRTLYNKLKEKKVENFPTSFPKKNYLKRLSPETIEVRKEGFNTFFAELLALPDVLIRHAEVRDFLSLRTLIGESGTSGSDRAADISSVLANTAGSGPVQGRVMFDFVPQADDELALHVGDIVVLSSDPDGGGPWWEGKIGTRSGLFPANHISIIGSGALYDASAVPPIPPRISEELKVKRLTLMDAQRKLSSAVGAHGWDDQPPPPPSSSSSSTQQTSPSPPTLAPVVEQTSLATDAVRVVATHAYQGDPESDISFVKGDVIEVLEVDDESGWWFGRLNDDEGLFPSTFTKPL